MSADLIKTRDLSRREFIQTFALGGAALATSSILGSYVASAFARTQTRPAPYTYSLDQDWLFGGRSIPDAINPLFDDRNFSRVTLPHCVSKLSWQKWDPSDWEQTWIYRRHFVLPKECTDRRVFLEFDGVMVGTTPVINGHELPQHLGGYLPSRYEITDWLKTDDNVLAVTVDSRWSNVPPEGSPEGPKRIDYLEPGGIIRPARLHAFPPTFISDVFARPMKVLDSDRRLEITCTVDAGTLDGKSVQVQIELLDGSRTVSRVQEDVHIEKVGQTQVSLTRSKLGNIKLWDVHDPRLYTVVATLFVDNEPVHEHRVRTGFREARFELDGFFLNGRRLQLFGLNRHELFPYVGAAMPRRVLRRDAEILRREFNCNIVRCSHYPQSESFLDACDELGLMVWEEVPGWGYLGDDAWRELLLRDVDVMVRRDRNHPAIIIWGTRVNESPSDEELYRKTRSIAKSLDGSRPTSGSMTGGTRKTWEKEWHENVFAFDDYHAAPDGSVGIREPVTGVPYMLAEAVGQFNYSSPKEGFNAKYRRAGDVTMQMQQGIRHAQAHDKAAADPRICGVIGWCGFDYGSLVNPYNNVKCPGVADVFRVPKLGASFYRSQISPGVRPVILPDFYWDFGPDAPSGPGQDAMIFSNCGRLEVFVGDKLRAKLKPEASKFPHLQYPPFVADLEVDGKNHPELRIDGYVGDKLVLSKRYSSDPGHDMFLLKSDDDRLVGDGCDATRLEFKVADKFGEIRLRGNGLVSFKVRGPGEIVGDNPFDLSDSGGVGAVWLKTQPDSSGLLIVEASHSSLGVKSVAVKVMAEKPVTRI